MFSLIVYGISIFVFDVAMHFSQQLVDALRFEADSLCCSTSSLLKEDRMASFNKFSTEWRDVALTV